MVASSINDTLAAGNLKPRSCKIINSEGKQCLRLQSLGLQSLAPPHLEWGPLTHTLRCLRLEFPKLQSLGLLPDFKISDRSLAG